MVNSNETSMISAKRLPACDEKNTTIQGGC
jgi:hypothetical protein